MTDDLENPDVAADRLEAALERIARLATIPPAPASNHAPGARSDADLSVAEIAERLDLLIARLRAALDDGAEPE